MTGFHRSTAGRPRTTRSLRLVGGLVALVAAGAAVGVAVPSGQDPAPVADAAGSEFETGLVTTERADRVSRSAVREPLVVQPRARVRVRGSAPAPVPDPVGSRFATAGINVRTGPGDRWPVVTVLDMGTKVAITGAVVAGFAQIVYDGSARWVAADYLAKRRPEPEPEPEPEPAPTGGGISAAPCPSGSSVESGLTPDAVRVHRAVCARFPSVTSYGGLRDDGTHAEGRALDVMVSSQDLGWAIAEWVRANAGALGVSEVIFAQRIWTVERSSEGWRWMEDRGSATANHYDHVHVTVYGYSGS